MGWSTASMVGSPTASMVGSPTGSTAVSAEVSSLDTGAAKEADIVKAEAKRRESESVEQNPAGPLARPAGFIHLASASTPLRQLTRVRAYDRHDHYAWCICHYRSAPRKIRRDPVQRGCDHGRHRQGDGPFCRDRAEISRRQHHRRWLSVADARFGGRS